MSFKRRVYFRKVSFLEARRLLQERLIGANLLAGLGSERIPTEEGIGRITSRAHYGKNAVPPMSTAAMDGVALDFRVTLGATPQSPRALREGTHCWSINTGFPLPPLTNAVVMVENLLTPEEGVVAVEEPASFAQHVRTLGEDITLGEMVYPSFKRITPEGAALLYAAGVREVDVLEPLRVLLLPTGDELKARGEPFDPQGVYETNSLFILAHLKSWGYSPEVLPPVEDRWESLEGAVYEALKGKPSLLFLSAGTSSGTKDFVPTLLEKRGELIFHGVDYSPGKPFCFGVLENTPVFGIPGYPGAAAGVLREFLEPVLRRVALQPPPCEEIEAEAAWKVLSPLGTREYLKGKVGRVGNSLLFYPLKRGSSVLSPEVEKDGLLVVGEEREGLSRGERAKVVLTRSREEVEEQILFVGSNDLLIAEIRNLLLQGNPYGDMAIITTGSLRGLQTVTEGGCHLAGIHLLDGEEGSYNIPYLRRAQGREKLLYWPLFMREQGILTLSGNPCRVNSLAGLTQEGVRFMNRQRGSGTRILLDYLLGKLHIEGERILGYHREVFTHLEAALAVAKGEADAAVAVKPVAGLLGLDFLPLAEEEYGIVLRREFVETKPFEAFRQAYFDRRLRERAEELGGYRFLEGQPRPI